jgi:hypothetical protein
VREELNSSTHNRSIADGGKRKLNGLENLKKSENHAILYIESEREISSLELKKN